MNLQFKSFAAVARLALYDLARYFCRGLFHNVVGKAVVRKFGRVNALHGVARGAQNYERKVAHVPYVVNGALDRNYFALVLLERGVGGGAVV